MKKTIISWITTGSILTSLFFSQSAYANSIVNIILDGSNVNFPDAQPVIVNGRTMVPISLIAKDLNASVVLNGNNTFSIVKGSKRIDIKWNSNIAFVNGKAVVLDTPAYISDDRTYVPLRFVSEAFSGTVAYDNNKSAVVIDTFDPSNKDIATVTKVIDGDSFGVKINNISYTVRLIGIDTPALSDANRPAMQYANEALNYTNSLLNNQNIYLNYDVKRTDSYGRLLAYAYLMDGTFVNAKLVSNGYARIETMTPNNKHDMLFSDLLKQSQQEKMGVWNLYQDPWEGKDSIDWSQDNIEYPPFAEIPNNTTSTTGNLKITYFSPRYGTLDITNNDKKDIDLTNWTIVSNSNNMTYHFPNGYFLKSGMKVTITTSNLAFNNPPQVLKWTNNSVFNINGDTVSLYDGNGNLVFTLHQGNN